MERYLASSSSYPVEYGQKPDGTDDYCLLVAASLLYSSVQLHSHNTLFSTGFVTLMPATHSVSGVNRRMQFGGLTQGLLFAILFVSE